MIAWNAPFSAPAASAAGAFFLDDDRSGALATTETGTKASFSQFQRKAQVYLRMILVCVYDSTHAAAFMVLQQFSFIVGRLVRPVQPAVVFASQRYAG
ncbi:hypothetical protein ACHFCA_10770 [Delftia tsuruhatensis]